MKWIGRGAGKLSASAHFSSNAFLLFPPLLVGLQLYCLGLLLHCWLSPGLLLLLLLLLCLHQLLLLCLILLPSLTLTILACLLLYLLLTNVGCWADAIYCGRRLSHPAELAGVQLLVVQLCQIHIHLQRQHSDDCKHTNLLDFERCLRGHQGRSYPVLFFDALHHSCAGIFIHNIKLIPMQVAGPPLKESLIRLPWDGKNSHWNRGLTQRIRLQSQFLLLGTGIMRTAQYRTLFIYRVPRTFFTKNNQITRASRSSHWGYLIAFKHARPGKPPKPPLKAPNGTTSLGLQTSSSLEIGRQVRRQQRGRQ